MSETTKAPYPFRRVRVRLLVALELAALAVGIALALFLGLENPWSAVGMEVLILLAMGAWIGAAWRGMGLDLGRLLGPVPGLRTWVSLVPVLLLILGFDVLFQGLRGLVLGPAPPSGDLLPGDLPVTLLQVTVNPVLEEVSSRGMVLHRWALKWGRTRAVLASTVLFAVAHETPLTAFFFGLFAVFLYLRTGSLWPPILAHALVNTVAGILNATWGGVEPLAGLYRSFAWILGTAFGGLTLVLVVWMIRNRPRGEPLPYFRSSH